MQVRGAGRLPAGAARVQHARLPLPSVRDQDLPQAGAGLAYQSEYALAHHRSHWSCYYVETT